MSLFWKWSWSLLSSYDVNILNPPCCLIFEFTSLVKFYKTRIRYWFLFCDARTRNTSSILIHILDLNSPSGAMLYSSMKNTPLKKKSVLSSFLHLLECILCFDTTQHHNCFPFLSIYFLLSSPQLYLSCRSPSCRRIWQFNSSVSPTMLLLTSVPSLLPVKLHLLYSPTYHCHLSPQPHLKTLQPFDVYCSQVHVSDPHESSTLKIIDFDCRI